MNFTPVESTSLAAVAYDETRELLRVQFRSRAVYHYFAVPAAVHKALLQAPSKGGYFNQAIRPRYRFVRVPGLPPDAPGGEAPPQDQEGGAPWHAR